MQDLKAALVANDGDTQMAVASLSAEGTSDSKLAESLNQKAAGPSSDTKAGKSSSALKPQVSASKGMFYTSTKGTKRVSFSFEVYLTVYYRLLELY